MAALAARLEEEGARAAGRPGGAGAAAQARGAAARLAEGDPGGALAPLSQLIGGASASLGLVAEVLFDIIEAQGRPGPEVRDAALVLAGAAAPLLLTSRGAPGSDRAFPWGWARVARTLEAARTGVPEKGEGSRLPEAVATPTVPPGLPGESAWEAGPFVARGLAGAWPAVSKWDAGYLASQGRGERICAVEIGESFDAPGFEHKLMAFGHFLHLSGLSGAGSKGESQEKKGTSCCGGRAAYLAQHLLFDQFPELLGDLGPPPWPDGASAAEPPRAWIGGGGSRTPAHRDPKDNLLVQVAGEKFCRLYPPDSAMHTYPPPGRTHVSRAPVHRLSRSELGEQFPGFPARGGFLDVTLRQGDCLYIPKGWFHYVQSLSPSISINFWFLQPGCAD